MCIRDRLSTAGSVETAAVARAGAFRANLLRPQPAPGPAPEPRLEPLLDPPPPARFGDFAPPAPAPPGPADVDFSTVFNEDG